MKFESRIRKQTIHKHTREILYSALISVAVIMATNPTVVSAQTTSQKTKQTAEQKVKKTTEQTAEQKAKSEAEADQSITEIVVTGIRGGIISSIAKKRNSSSIVEALSAEDIGKLPDASIGESLARLPGLAAQRFDGRANKISIRGLAPDFTTTTLNGREMVSSDNNRSVEFDQFPSDLITGATVYKTPDASLTSQAVGGTVDMQTVRPLNYKEPVFVVGARGEVSDQGSLNSGTKAWGYRGNLTYIGQNDAGTLGYALGYSRTVQPIQEKYVHYWGYSNVGGANKKLFLDGVKPFVKSNELTRDGFLGVVEFKPNDQWYSRIDAFYSKFKDNQTLRGMEVAGYTKSSGGVVTVDRGLVTKGVFNGVKTMNRNDFSDRDVSTYAVGWNSKYHVDENWDIESDLSYSKAKRTYAANEIYSGSGRGGTGLTDNIGYVLKGQNGIVLSHGLDYSDPNVWKLGDNLGWGGPFCTSAMGWKCNSQDGFRNTETSEDDMTAIKLAVVRQFEGPISSIKFGARYSIRNKHHTRKGEFLTLKDYPKMVSVPKKYLLPPTSVNFVGMGNLLSFNSRGLVKDGFYFFSPADKLGAATNTWSIKEKIFNAYVMANIDTEIGYTPVTGNIGVQVVNTDQSSGGVAAQKNGNKILSSNIVAGVKYWDILPSLNLSLDIAENKKIRIGIARVLARPRMDQMNASRTFSFNNTNVASTDILKSPWGGGGGNPKLRPWKVWQFDISYETYFGGDGYISVAAFYKKLENQVFDQKVLVDFTGVTAPSQATPALMKGFISAPANGSGGYIYGFELSASVPFRMISENLDGFGALMSASFTDSLVKKTPQSRPEVLPGLSKVVLNGTLYYEKDGFQARLSVRHRSKYVAEAFAIGLSRQETIAKAETIFDAQVSYDLDELGFAGLTVYLQGSNLTNEPFVQYYNNDPRQVKNYHTYGRNFMFGLTYKM